MGNSSDLEAVVLSSDSAIVESVSQSLIRAEIRPAIFRDSRSATECLFRKKVDAIIVDLHVDSAIEVLKELSNTPSNSQVPIFAVTNSSFRESFGLAHFTFDAPIHQPSFVRALRMAYPVMLRGHYHYRRHAVELPVTMRRAADTFTGLSVNISEGGMAVQSDVPFERNDRLQLEFRLSRMLTIKCQSEVIWSNAKHLIGLRFLSLKPSFQRTLSIWLADQS